MSDNPNTTAENFPEKEPAQTTAATSSETESFPGSDLTASSINKNTQDMEVHHHGHVHEKKKWREYVFQFLMLFLAVFLGSLAENRREHGIERHREKDYMESLLTDIKNDSTTSELLDANIFSQVKKIDNLQTLFTYDLRTGPYKDSLVRECYALTTSILTFYPEFFNERTISQLLSSGNMRLIKKQGVADSIMEYHSYIKFVEVQKQLYVSSVNSCSQSMYNVFDITYLKSIMQNDTLYQQDISGIPVKLLTTDPAELKKFIALLENTKLVAYTYRGLLTDMTHKANRLYLYLRDRYKIGGG